MVLLLLQLFLRELDADEFGVGVVVGGFVYKALDMDIATFDDDEDDVGINPNFMSSI